MHDRPDAAEILSAVAAALRADTALTAFDRRVAAAALDIARREVQQDPRVASDIAARLARVLGVPAHGARAGELMERLAGRIRSGKAGEATPGLMDCLWQVTLARVAVDQPRFALYVRLSEEDAHESEP